MLPKKTPVGPLGPQAKVSRRQHVEGRPRSLQWQLAGRLAVVPLVPQPGPVLVYRLPPVVPLVPQAAEGRAVVPLVPQPRVVPVPRVRTPSASQHQPRLRPRLKVEWELRWKWPVRMRGS